MGRMRFGVHRPLEDEATALITASLVGVTSQTAKSDILTPWKEEQRKRREVFNDSGVADSAVRRGMYHRALNTTLPHLNARDGVVQPRRESGERSARRSSYDPRSSLLDHVSSVFDPESD